MRKEMSSSYQLGYVRRYKLTEGKEEGLKFIEVDTGKLRFLLNESKALDIAQLFFEGINYSFISKNEFSLVDNSFVKRFEGGMLYTCGIDNIGVQEGYIQHGTLHNIPAKLQLISNDDDKIIIEAEIKDAALFGKNLKLIRRYETNVLSNKLTIKDKLVNLGTKDENYALIYHMNFGYPFLQEGVEIIRDKEGMEPKTEFAKKYLNNNSKFLAPEDNIEERCFYFTHKEPRITLINRNLKKEVIITYSNKTLPYTIEWHSNASHDYVLGIEPTTSRLDHLLEYKVIKPNEVIEFEVNLEFNDIN